MNISLNKLACEYTRKKYVSNSDMSHFEKHQEQCNVLRLVRLIYHFNYNGSAKCAYSYLNLAKALVPLF